jgi:hypothetical protein
VASKKVLNNSVLADRRPLLKKKLENKFTNANTIKDIYVNNNSLRKALVGIDKKASKIKMNKKLRKRISKNNKRKEFELIDLTLNQRDSSEIDGNTSEFNFTTTEGSLPPLERSSKCGSELGEDSKHNERYARSHERAREPLNFQKKTDKKSKHFKNDLSNNNSILIDEAAISLASGAKSNMRSDILNLQKDLSFDNRALNKSDVKSKRIGNINLNSSIVKGKIDRQKLQKMTDSIKLRKFSRSDKKVENISIRSNSRKNRVLSKNSSKLNLEEFTKIKLENEKFKQILGDIVQIFNKFKNQFT